MRNLTVLPRKSITVIGAKNIRENMAWLELDLWCSLVWAAFHQDPSWFQSAGHHSSALAGQNIHLLCFELIGVWQHCSDSNFMTNTSVGEEHMQSKDLGSEPHKMNRLAWVYMCTQQKPVLNQSPYISMGVWTLKRQSWQKNCPMHGLPHTHAVCCGNGNTIWLTAVWMTHKEDRIVPWHFHSWSKPPLYIFLQKCVCEVCMR